MSQLLSNVDRFTKNAFRKTLKCACEMIEHFGKSLKTLSNYSKSTFSRSHSVIPKSLQLSI